MCLHWLADGNSLRIFKVQLNEAKAPLMSVKNYFARIIYRERHGICLSINTTDLKGTWIMKLRDFYHFLLDSYSSYSFHVKNMIKLDTVTQRTTVKNNSLMELQIETLFHVKVLHHLMSIFLINILFRWNCQRPCSHFQ